MGRTDFLARNHKPGFHLRLLAMWPIVLEELQVVILASLKKVYGPGFTALVRLVLQVRIHLNLKIIRKSLKFNLNPKTPRRINGENQPIELQYSQMMTSLVDRWTGGPVDRSEIIICGPLFLVRM